MIGIYKITSPKGRVYIGQSIQIEKRQRTYRKGSNYKNQTRLYASLIKYGFSEHVFEVVEECAIEELNTRERHWQDFYNVIGPQGLNCKLTETADQSGKFSKESLEKKSRSMKGKNKGIKRSLEAIQKGIQTKKELGTNLHSKETRDKIAKTLTGRVRPQEVGDKISKTTTGRPNLALSKQVLQFTSNGQYVNTFSSVTAAEKFTGLFNISRCALGKQKHSGGFIWKYE